MSKIIPKKPALVYNSIEHQSKTAANSLTIGEWNRVVNILKQQANLNTKYLEDLHRMLFYDWNSDDSGYLVGEVLAVFYGYSDSANIAAILQGKVDKVAGKGLSDENFTLLEKNKLANITQVVPDEETMVFNADDKLEATNVSIWRYE